MKSVALTMLAAAVLMLPGHQAAAADKPEQRKHEITDEQLREIGAKREQFKDNPRAMKFLDAVQDELGITADDIARAQGKTTAEPESQAADEEEQPIEGDPHLAGHAYNSGDYETAYEHYQALADDGDAYASLMLGLMYQQGLGVESSMARAHAYYERAAERGDKRGRELLRNIEHGMSTTEKEQAGQEYQALFEEQQNDP